MVEIDRLWALKDGGGSSCFKVDYNRALELNDNNYGIFWTPNVSGDKRTAEQVKSISYWYCDIDSKTGGEKKEQLNRILTLVAKPSWVVETKNGYHCYWKAKTATKDTWSSIEAGIIHKMKADPAVKDMPRLLRAVGFYHCKDPNNKFFIHSVYENDEEYTEDEMLFFFPEPIVRVEISNKYEGMGLDFFKNPDNWEKVFHLSRITNGHRNSDLTRCAYKAYMNGFRGNDLLLLMTNLNQRIAGKPLHQSEINAMIRRLK